MTLELIMEKKVGDSILYGVYVRGSNMLAAEATISYPVENLEFVLAPASGSPFDHINVIPDKPAGKVSFTVSSSSGAAVTTADKIIIAKLQFKAIKHSGGAAIPLKISQATWRDLSNSAHGFQTTDNYSLIVKEEIVEATMWLEILE